MVSGRLGVERKELVGGRRLGVIICILHTLYFQLYFVKLSVIISYSS